MRQLDIIAALLKEGKVVRIPVRGNSMRPYLVHERDFVILQKSDDINIGDTVLAEVSPVHYVLHRIVDIKGQKVTLRGDGNIATEDCELKDICGKAIAFERKSREKQENPSSLKYRFYSWIWMHSLPFRSLMLRVHNVLFNSCKDLSRFTPKPIEIDAMLSLLQSALWNKNASSEYLQETLAKETVRWNVIWQLAVEQTLTGLVAEAIKRLPQDLQPASISEQINKIAGTFIVQHQRINTHLIRTFEFLKSKGFTPILFKGQGNAARYPNPVLRQCGDIDIYIGRKDYDRACGCISEFVGNKEFEKGTESSKHFHVNYGPSAIELHRVAEVQANPLTNMRYLVLTEHWLTQKNADSVLIGGREVLVPPRQFNVIYVFNHLWHHLLLGGIGLRQVCDWSILLHEAYGKIDVTQLENDLKNLHLIRGWKTMGWIAVNKIGLPENEMPLYDSSMESVALKTWSIILDVGNFGKYGASRGRNFKVHWIRRKAKSFVLTIRYFLPILPISPEDVIFAYCHWFIAGIKDVIKNIIKIK